MSQFRLCLLSIPDLAGACRVHRRGVTRRWFTGAVADVGLHGFCSAVYT